ncbi:MAG: putative Ig domain-containing protein [Thermodesulfovibrionales bacterium]|nr:putative Ig domain-containing protein [Thermodesulfovibrionales bacterium]
MKGVVIPRIHTCKSLCLVALLFFLSCSSEKPAGVGTQKPSETTGGEVSTTVTTAPVSSVTNQLNAVEAKNTPPALTKIKIMPEVFKAGDVLYVDVAGSDPDEDEVTILYEWTKNGESVSKDKQINAAIKRGDKLDIKITPYDGKAYGRSVILHREIVNLPPMIIADKDSRFDGNLFTYQVKASDADNDALTYSLKAAPAGMTIDKSTGFLRWDVPEGFKGKASFTVSASDGQWRRSSAKFYF